MEPTYNQTTTIKGDYNKQNELTKIYVTTSYIYSRNVGDMVENDSSNITFTFNQNDKGEWVSKVGRESISFRNPEELRNCVEDVYNNAHYKNEEPIVGREKF